MQSSSGDCRRGSLDWLGGFGRSALTASPARGPGKSTELDVSGGRADHGPLQVDQVGEVSPQRKGRQDDLENDHQDDGHRPLTKQ